MPVEIVKGDLFESDDNLAHCVSEDLVMGKGIATTFKEKFGSVQQLVEQKKTVGEVAYITHDSHYIFYLVTKRVYYSKPTYKSLASSLMNLHALCQELGIKTLSMPKIGCGLDKLKWDKVLQLLKDIFTDVQITVYEL